MIYFILKAIFVPKYLRFSPDFFGYGGKWFAKKSKVNHKI